MSFEGVNSRKPDEVGSGVRASILIATRNNVATLERVIAACFAQKLSSGKYEIVLVDDASDAPQLALLDQFEADYAAAIANGLFRIFRCETQGGLALRRNMTAREGRGEIVTYIDGDAIPEPDWLEQILHTFDDASVGVVASRLLFDSAASLANAQGGTLSLYGFGLDRFLFQPVDNLPDHSEEVLYAMGCGLALRKELWEKVGGFDEGLVYGYEDVDLPLYVWGCGMRVVTQPMAVIRHRTMSYDTPNRFRMFIYMRNRWHFLIKHWPIRWLLKAFCSQMEWLLLSPEGRTSIPIFGKAMRSLLPSVPKLIKSRSKRCDEITLSRMVWPHHVPVATYWDTRLLHEAALTPVRKVNWNDGDTFRLGGGFHHPDTDCVSVVNNGWIDVAAFASSKSMLLTVDAQEGRSVEILLVEDGERSSTRVTVTCEEKLSFDLSVDSRICKFIFTADGCVSDGVSPTIIARICEVTQS